MSDHSKNPYPSPATCITSTSGRPVPSDHVTMTAGQRGPVLLQDAYLLEKLAHQNRERIPERTVHAKGSGALGTLRITRSITQYTKACLFSKVGGVVPVLVRFSTVAGEMGAADAERDVRGFAVKIYTEEGNWDIVGNNTPVFFINDPLKFPDFIHTQKRHPRTHLRCSIAMWDFFSYSPESLHQITILFSDRGIPQSYRFMNGYGSHTYSMVNQEQQRVWVKFHFKSRQGIKTWTNGEAEKIVGQDRDSSQRDLYYAIENKEFPSWTWYVQIMTEEQATKYEHNPFDLTKVWSHAHYPLLEVGIMELDTNPQNYFTEIEQAAFSPSNIIPGINFSPDRVLQARIFSYPDAQRYRVGTHYQSLPSNAPKCPMYNNHRGGAMCYYAFSSDAFYTPHSFSAPESPAESSTEPTWPCDAGGLYEQKSHNDYFVQPRALYHLFDAAHKERFYNNIAQTMTGVPAMILNRQLGLFDNIDNHYGQGVRSALKKNGVMVDSGGYVV